MAATTDPGISSLPSRAPLRAVFAAGFRATGGDPRAVFAAAFRATGGELRAVLAASLAGSMLGSIGEGGRSGIVSILGFVVSACS